MAELEKYFLQPGFIFVTQEPYLVHTVLGSCVAVCLWDAGHKIGAMNHYLFGRDKRHERTARFGEVSIPHMIHLMVAQGAELKALRAHLVGGGQHHELNSFIGAENIQIAEASLKKFEIEIATRDVGGQIGRKVIFNTVSGEILIYKVNKIRESDWYWQ